MSDVNVHDTYSKRHQVHLIDVREVDEFAAAHVEGAVNIPLGSLPERLGEIDRTRPLIAMCRSGNRSARATAFLQSSGFAVDNMTGGMLAWQSAGLPTT